MCGLVVLRERGAGPGEIRARVTNATRLLAHRGPDGEGIWVDPQGEIGFGHRRLAIIDPSPAASQPMIDARTGNILVLNGEIYNFRELARALGAAEADRCQRSDTAVALAMLTRDGHQCLEQFEGMFALAFFDRTKGSLVFARDKFGEKPLYLSQGPGHIAAFSELRAFSALFPGRQWAVDPSAIEDYLITGSIAAPKTVLRGAEAVKPGHWVEIGRWGDRAEAQYWRPLAHLDQRPSGIMISREEAALEAGRLLERTVELSMVSDVPVGIFASGGYDSTAILLVLGQLGMAPAEAICVDFESPGFSEWVFAKQAAHAAGVPIHRVTIQEQAFVGLLPCYFRAMDQPTCDGYNTFFVAQAAAASGVRVWLSGCGGDELFGGYPSFSRLGRLRLLSRLGRPLGGIGPSLPLGTWSARSLRAGRFLQLVSGGDAWLRAYECCRHPMPRRFVERLIGQVGTRRPQREERAQVAAPVLPPGWGVFHHASIFETFNYLQNQLLRDIDNFSSWWSLEVRSPFLNAGLLEFLLSLPHSVVSGGQGVKPLLRAAVPGLGPLLRGRAKAGFSFPVGEWLQSTLTHSCQELLTDKSNSGLWDPNEAAALWGAYKRGALHWSTVWQLYALGSWHQAHSP